MAGLFLVLAGTAPLYAAVCTGMTVRRVWKDAALHRQWQALTDCRHPERPWKLTGGEGEQEAAPGLPGAPPQAANISKTVMPGFRPPVLADWQAALRSQASPPVLVKQGSTVRFWKSDRDGRIELSGIALNAGAEGDAIHVHLQGSSLPLRGIVRGTGSVEILGVEKQVWGQP